MKLPHLVRCLAVLPIAAFFASAQDAGLPPGAPLLPESALPDYEKEIDHAGLIHGWNKASLTRGEKIYQAVCHVCHGDLNLPGSIPNALRFAEGTFGHGADPHTLYQTLTRGWRLMAPQVAPRPAREVRRHPLPPRGLPPPATIRRSIRRRSPPPTSPALPKRQLHRPGSRETRAVARPWTTVAFLLATYRESPTRPRRTAAAQLKGAQLDAVTPGANIAQKGIAVRLDAGAGGVAAGRAWVVFEHDTLRLAAGWTGEGFIDWEGINFNGRHVVRPRTLGTPHFETADAPGWANPATGRFDDPRLVGADGRRFGPVPRTWMRFRGLYRAADRIVLSYNVGGTAILETHDLELAPGGDPVFVRTLNLGASPHDLHLRVANAGTAVALSGPPGLVLTDRRRVRHPAPSGCGHPHPARPAPRPRRHGNPRSQPPRPATSRLSPAAGPQPGRRQSPHR
jgi:cytochrome c5